MCSVEWSNETILFKCFIINDLQFNIHKLQLFKSGGMFHDILLFFYFWDQFNCLWTIELWNNFLNFAIEI